MYTDSLFDAIKSYNIPDDISYTDMRRYRAFISQIEILIDISTRKDINIGIILSIQKNDTTLTIIPRDVRGMIRNFLSVQSGGEVILTGYNISGPIM
jgi:hypothetical protein